MVRILHSGQQPESVDGLVDAAPDCSVAARRSRNIARRVGRSGCGSQVPELRGGRTVGERDVRINKLHLQQVKHFANDSGEQSG